MKKITTLFVATVIWWTSQAQSSQTRQATNTQDSTKKDSVKFFALILSEGDLRQLIQLISTSDEKPSVIREWTAYILSRAQEIKKQDNKK